MKFQVMISDAILDGGEIPGTGKTLKQTLVEQYIAQANTTKNATIAVTGYPRFFDKINEDYSKRIAVKKVLITSEEKKWMNEKVDAMNEIINSAVSEAQREVDKLAASNARIVYVDLGSEFYNRGVDSESSYINDIYGFDRTGWWAGNQDELFNANTGSFHPNKEGQQARARAIRSTLESLPVN